MDVRNVKPKGAAFLVCDGCGYCCYVQGPVAHRLEAAPVACPGCGSRTRLARREPWRDRDEPEQARRSA